MAWRMKTPRFNYHRNPSATSRPGARKYLKWIRVSHIGGLVLRDSSGSRRRKIFAIVAPPMPADHGRKTIQRVLIFDNHPDSLRLVSGQNLNPDVDLAAGRVRGAAAIRLRTPRHASHSHLILGLALIVTLVLTMFWPLFVR
jgi:hypothetical protein